MKLLVVEKIANVCFTPKKFRAHYNTFFVSEISSAVFSTSLSHLKLFIEMHHWCVSGRWHLDFHKWHLISASKISFIVLFTNSDICPLRMCFKKG